MRKYAATFSVFLCLLGSSLNAACDETTTETVVMLRHGEKPFLGLGQLNCQGLNRALALPPVIKHLFGAPDSIFAPNPSHTKRDLGGVYDYVRPLATIEPTAIFFGMPVDTTYGFDEVDALVKAVERPALRNSLTVVAWEHREIESIARGLLSENGGTPALVPGWDGDDFDSLYVVKVIRHADSTSASFEHLHEGLDGQPTKCPS